MKKLLSILCVSVLALSANKCSDPEFKRPEIPECRILEKGESFCIQGDEEFNRENYSHREISIEEEKEITKYLNDLESCFLICYKHPEECDDCSGSVLEK